MQTFSMKEMIVAPSPEVGRLGGASAAGAAGVAVASGAGVVVPAAGAVDGAAGGVED